MPKAFTPAEQRARIERPTRLLKQCPRCRVVRTSRAFNRTAWRIATYCRACQRAYQVGRRELEAKQRVGLLVQPR